MEETKNRETSQSNAPAAARPVEEVRLGTVKAAIWRNETEHGVRYSVTFEKLYRDQSGWRSTGSFGRDDLLVLAKAADQAHTWILASSREAKEGAETNATPGPMEGLTVPRY